VQQQNPGITTVFCLDGRDYTGNTGLADTERNSTSMDLREALEQLEQQGHTIEYKAVVTAGERFYHVDGMPRTEDQILKWVVDGVRPGS